MKNKPWTMREVLLLIMMIDSDDTYGKICSVLGRSLRGVEYMERRLRRTVKINGHVIGFSKRKVKK